MTKIRAVQWIGLIPFIILIVLLSLLWFLTGFNKAIFYILALIILVGMYFATHLFAYDLFTYGEQGLSNDKELLNLEKEESSLWWAYISGAGFTFLIGGLPEFQTNPIMAIVGLSFLILGNLVYNLYFYPRYRLLVRKRLIELRLKDRFK